MKDPTRDAESLLEDLVRTSRMDAPPEHVERLEQKLSPWLEPKSTPAIGSRGLSKIAIATAAIGVIVVGAVVWQPYEGSSGPALTREASTWLPSRATGFVRNETPTTLERAPADAGSQAARDRASAALDLARAKATLPRSPGERPAGIERTTRPADVAMHQSREAEVNFLRRAQEALATSPGGALKMTDDHPALYPRGILVQEREVIAIDALVRLGHHDQAAARAEAFRTRFPGSAHLSRVAALTENR